MAGRPGRITRWVASCAVLTVLGSAARSHAAPGCDPDASAAKEVRAAALGIIAADNARDLARVLRYYAPEAVLMPPGEPPVMGREAIRSRYEGLFSRFNPEIEAHIDEACAAGSLAFVRGRNSGRMVARAGGAARALDDVYLMILRHDPGEGWRITRLIWHPGVPGDPKVPG